MGLGGRPRRRLRSPEPAIRPDPVLHTRNAAGPGAPPGRRLRSQRGCRANHDSGPSAEPIGHQARGRRDRKVRNRPMGRAAARATRPRATAGPHDRTRDRARHSLPVGIVRGTGRRGYRRSDAIRAHLQSHRRASCALDDPAGLGGPVRTEESRIVEPTRGTDSRSTVAALSSAVIRWSRQVASAVRQESP